MNATVLQFVYFICFMPSVSCIIHKEVEEEGILCAEKWVASKSKVLPCDHYAAIIYLYLRLDHTLSFVYICVVVGL
jgi:hypothetical protein